MHNFSSFTIRDVPISFLMMKIYWRRGFANLNGFQETTRRVIAYNQNIPSAMGSARLNAKIIIGAILPNANDAARFSLPRREDNSRCRRMENKQWCNYSRSRKIQHPLTPHAQVFLFIFFFIIIFQHNQTFSLAALNSPNPSGSF